MNPDLRPLDVRRFERVARPFRDLVGREAAPREVVGGGAVDLGRTRDERQSGEEGTDDPGQVKRGVKVVASHGYRVPGSETDLLRSPETL
jgi:hypothetical protein